MRLPLAAMLIGLVLAILDGCGLPEKRAEEGGPGGGPGCYDDDVSPEEPVDDLEATFESDAWLEIALDLLGRRYPAGRCVVEPQTDDPRLADWVETGDFVSFVESLDTLVHEGTHTWQSSTGSYEGYQYFVNCDMVITTEWHDSFPRAEILSLADWSHTALYRDYFEGEMGEQGLNVLLDEWNAYTNGFGASAVFAGEFRGADGSGYLTGAVDGPLAFAYFTELYLRVARTDHPEEYEFITGDESFKSVLLTTWNRMHFFLSLVEGKEWLKVEADEIAKLVYAPENMGELEDALGMTLSKSNCQ
ncbi:MAG: hypothetical protein HY897_01095 [Deltaproteobacteria bacterium]|nr:hypothetical protein [Deltaproteobacteria bacterium]